MSNVYVTTHARERTEQRLPELCRRYGRDAVVEMIKGEVMQAAFLNMFTRTAPGWCRMQRKQRSADQRFLRMSIDGHDLLAVVARRGHSWSVVTVVTPESGRTRTNVALAPLPVLPCGRTIGRPMTRPLPPAVAAMWKAA